MKTLLNILLISALLFLGCRKQSDNITVKCAMCTTTATVYFNYPKDGYPKVFSDSIKRCDISIDRFERINKVDTPPMEEFVDTLIMYTKVQTRCRWIEEFKAITKNTRKNRTIYKDYVL